MRPSPPCGSAQRWWQQGPVDLPVEEQPLTGHLHSQHHPFAIGWIFTDAGHIYRTELTNGVLIQELRHGSVTEAVAWYPSSGRLPRRLPCQATRNATSCMTQVLPFWLAVPA